MISGVVGALIHLVIMRPLRRSSPLMRVVATLALLAFVREAAFKRYGRYPRPVDGIVPDGSVQIFGATVGKDRMYFFIIAVALYGALYVFYRTSRFGLATTGVAENQAATAALGWYTLRAEASVQLISCRVSARSSSAAGGGTSFSSSGNPILVHVGAERSISSSSKHRNLTDSPCT